MLKRIFFLFLVSTLLLAVPGRLLAQENADSSQLAQQPKKGKKPVKSKKTGQTASGRSTLKNPAIPMSSYRRYAAADSTRLNFVGCEITYKASRDVGMQEFRDKNDHPIYSFYRKIGKSGDVRVKGGAFLPTCGFAVNAWHIMAGVTPRNPSPGVALSWSNQPKSHIYQLGPNAQRSVISQLRPGMVMQYRFNSGRRTNYHVGVLETPYAIYGTVIESNTSTKRAIGVYGSDNYGVIRKKRFYATTRLAADWRDSPRSAPGDSARAEALRLTYLKRLPADSLAALKKKGIQKAKTKPKTKKTTTKPRTPDYIVRVKKSKKVATQLDSMQKRGGEQGVKAAKMPPGVTPEAGPDETLNKPGAVRKRRLEKRDKPVQTAPKRTEKIKTL